MRLSDQAASYLAMETPTTPMHGVGVYVVAGEIDPAVLVDHIERRLDQRPRYRQRVTYVPFNLAQPIWADDAQFDISNHITHHQVDGVLDRDAVVRCALDAIRFPLRRDRPLWHVHLFTGAPDFSVVAHVVHNTLLDTESVLDIGQFLLDLKSTTDSSNDNGSTWQPQKAPTGLELAQQALHDNTTGFSERSQRMSNFSSANSELVRRATESITRFMSEPVCLAPWNRGFVQSGRDFQAVNVDYGRIRAIRRALGGTENDVVLTVLSESVARYLKAHGVLVDDRHLRIMCPVRVRREDQSGSKQTRLSASFPVFDAVTMDIAERYKHVRWETESIKQNREAQALQLLTELIPPLPAMPAANDPTFTNLFANSGVNFTVFNPANLLRLFMPRSHSLPALDPRVNGAMAGFNFSCATMPGAQTRQFLAGHEVEQQFAFPVLAGNLGFGVAVTTYAQVMTFNLIADPLLVPDLDLIAQLIAQSVEELERAVSRAA